MEVFPPPAGTWVDPEGPHVLRDEWLGQRVALVYIPRHLLPAALVSPSAAVLKDFSLLTDRPPGDVVGAWGPTTWLVTRAQTPHLLAQLGLSADLILGVLAEVDRLILDPGT